MASEIKGLGGSPVAHTELATKTAQASPGKETQAAQGVASSDDSVLLTGTAAKLRDVEAGLKDVPVVDTKRVLEVRQAIADGRYQVDPARVAEKFLQHEQSLQNRSKDS